MLIKYLRLGRVRKDEDEATAKTVSSAHAGPISVLRKSDISICILTHQVEKMLIQCSRYRICAAGRNSKE
jgi:hypothetical protein